MVSSITSSSKSQGYDEQPAVGLCLSRGAYSIQWYDTTTEAGQSSPALASSYLRANLTASVSSPLQSAPCPGSLVAEFLVLSYTIQEP